jgi:hypothetical protein
MYVVDPYRISALAVSIYKGARDVILVRKLLNDKRVLIYSWLRL